MHDFPDLVNALTPDYFVQIISNASIDCLDKIETPNMVNLIVSLDGLAEYHDSNRGVGMFKRSIELMKKAQVLGFHLEVFSIVTKENINQIDEFEKTLKDLFNMTIPVTYHPRKPKSYLDSHPVSNRVGVLDNFSHISSEDRVRLGSSKHIFPPLDLGCYQISCMSDGNVYGCCEGITVLGKMTDDISIILKKFKDAIHSGCVEPDFRCGL
jgi:sulfatase maturation enzyme AslB (radical SAM superfamily)